MRGAILTIGREILLGTIVDTNSAFLSKELCSVGVEVVKIISVSDENWAIEEALVDALKVADLVVTTGGLGPTSDDITKKTIAGVLGRKLVLREDILEGVRRMFEDRGIEMPQINVSQGMVIDGAEVFPNPVGTAPGMLVREAGRIIVMLPGVPVEMKSLWKSMKPVLVREVENRGGKQLVFTTIHTTDLPESVIAERIEAEFPEVVPHLAYLPSYRGVSLRVMMGGENAQKQVRSYVDSLRRMFGDYVWGEDEDTLEEVVGRLLRERRWKIAVAESCTGGLIGGAFTRVPGSSDYFWGGVISYANDVKENVLGVSREVLNQHGAVSAECARAMAIGVRKLLGVDLGVSATGIAGPGGGTTEKPVGLVYIGLASEDDAFAFRFLFRGDRHKVREQTVYKALSIVRWYLATGRFPDTLPLCE